MDEKKLKRIVNYNLCYNNTETARKSGFSKTTIYSYKEKLKKMSKLERNILIAQIALENVKDVTKTKKDYEELIDDEMLK